MTDKELFKRFEAYAKDHGYSAEEACRAISVSRNSFYNWKNGKPISARARKAMLCITFEPAEKSVENQDGFLKIILKNWPFLDNEQKGRLAAISEDMAESLKKPKDSAGESFEKMA